jgi:4-hydroxybenzoate polyprenyltransferase
MQSASDMSAKQPAPAVAVKIVMAVVVDRIRKLEMANLAAAVSIAGVLHSGAQSAGDIAGAFGGLLRGIPDILLRTAFAFLLNALVYLNNDYIDVAIDLASSDKDLRKARFLSDNLRAALWAQWIIVAVLALVALVFDPGLLVPLVAGGGICWWYSAKLKHMPFLDIIAMIIWGVTMPLCGSPATSMLGWALALQLGLFSGVFESIQVMRDADDDVKQGVRTTGVVLGKPKTLLLARALRVACTVYAAAFMHPIAAVISAAALVVPFVETRIAQYWTRVKLVYGIAWLVICGWLFLDPQTAGLLAKIDHAARL